MEPSSCVVKENFIRNNDNGQKYETYKDSVHKQFLIAICVNLGNLLVGVLINWPAPMIPKLQNKELSPLEHLVSDSEASLIAAVMTCGTVVGAQLSGYLSNKIGRKPTIILAGVCDLIGNIVLLSAHNVRMLYFGRIIFGLGAGVTTIANVVYIGEIASRHIRGIILTFTGIAHTCGGLLVVSVAPYVSYSAVGYIGTFLSALYILGGFCITESPVFYVLKGKKEKARATLHKLGRDEDIRKELDTMIENTKMKKIQYTSLNIKRNLEWLEIFILRRNRKPFLITTTLFLVQELSGVMFVTFFATSIFKRAASSVPPDIATIILGTTQVFGAFLSPFFVERFGRRTLMLISTSLCGLCTALLGAHFYLDLIKYPLLDCMRWLPLVLLISFLFCFSIGLGIIPNVLAGEMFSPNVRSSGTSISVCLGWIVGTCSTLSFGYTTANATYIIFTVYGIINFFGFVFIVIFVPETKGKSLLEIEEMMGI